ncbi:hypothetical protein BVRB_6g155600 [Beta vulgaris subsp. vulgaris]|uniref:Uncharacterized protein n=1 Tax=Beta vulgaris subsp. vulgaris TaxID=3555 RepID=A0A0J8B8U1_BETVV|nr:hypothetical protein BVRB_6g155600 [Beta vulgaris subsp. vulgaris]
MGGGRVSPGKRGDFGGWEGDRGGGRAKDEEGAEPGSPHNSHREEESGPAQNQVAQEVREGDSDSDAHPHEDDADETTMETGSPAQNNNETGGTSTGTGL